MHEILDDGVVVCDREVVHVDALWVGKAYLFGGELLKLLIALVSVISVRVHHGHVSPVESPVTTKKSGTIVNKKMGIVNNSKKKKKC
ncbi:hypothetical protein TNCV_4984441 [Trichonephila clavipes]|nr:hypothetical protein TNCV_4984441 [Trichonephila clavipes]